MSRLRQAFRSRFAGLYVFGVVFMVASILLRTALAFHSAAELDRGFGALVKPYLVGLLFDLTTCAYVSTPAALFLLLMPDRVFRPRIIRRILLGIYTVILFLLLFDVAAEWLFWDEFGCRFNFIAVDYLIYTNELVGNIWESYPVPAILAGILLGAAAVAFFSGKVCLRVLDAPTTFRQRLRPAMAYVLIAIFSLLFLRQSQTEVTENHYNNELAKNGLYSFVVAFRDNIIDYDQFYVTRDDPVAFRRLRDLLRTENSTFVSDDPSDITRQIACPDPEKRCNVVLVMVESLSAKFLGCFGSPDGLTPNLDVLAADSLVFRNLYATGTRTTRGMEAVALSLPPTPGQSLVKRPDNANLFSIGQIFRSRGYDAKFLYSGRGYFDNMNAFFAGNGFRVIDQNDFSREEVTFSNAWGVCDEDLYTRSLKEADASFADGNPFFQFLMTTSNHRPYTYPQKIDIPSGSGRDGAVKYTDFAIGEFLARARGRPWFGDTLFVIVADHCASSAGKTDVPVAEYHIPLFLYAPGIIPSGCVDTLASQMDLAPTLLGLLRFSYRSKFFGRDVFRPGTERALLGTYQKLGLLEEGTFTLLGPRKTVRAYRLGPEGAQVECPIEERGLEDAVSYYQCAAHLIARQQYMPE